MMLHRPSASSILSYATEATNLLYDDTGLLDFLPLRGVCILSTYFVIDDNDEEFLPTFSRRYDVIY